MKKAALATLLFATVTTAALAQAPATQQKQAKTTQDAPKTLDQRADEITAGMVKNLRLVPDQAKKLQEINRTSMRHAEEARAKYKADPRKLAQQMDIISQTRLSQIKDILTEQQFAQYQSRREEKMGVPREAQSSPASRQGGYQENY
jgi:Spy/CpxP family protein refolding chaperone